MRPLRDTGHLAGNAEVAGRDLAELVIDVDATLAMPGGYTPACAAFSFLMSSFRMSVMAAMTLPAFSGSGSVSSPGRMVGAICQDTP